MTKVKENKVLDFNTPFLNLKGEPQKDDSGDQVTLGLLLANYISGAQLEDAVKFYDWAVKLYNDEKLSLDDSDFTKLKKMVEESQFAVAPQAQILKVINAV